MFAHGFTCISYFSNTFIIALVPLLTIFETSTIAVVMAELPRASLMHNYTIEIIDSIFIIFNALGRAFFVVEFLSILRINTGAHPSLKVE